MSDPPAHKRKQCDKARVFNVPVVKIFDGSNVYEPSKRVTQILSLLGYEVHRNPHTMSPETHSVFPYTADDLGLEKNAIMVKFQMALFGMLSGSPLVMTSHNSSFKYTCGVPTCSFEVVWSLKTNCSKENHIETMLQSAVGHHSECRFYSTSRTGCPMDFILQDFLIAMSLRIAIRYFKGDCSNTLAEKIIRFYFDDMEGIDTSVSAKSRRAIRDAFKYNKTYLNEESTGRWQMSGYKQTPYNFLEMYSFVRLVQHPKARVLQPNESTLLYEKHRSEKYHPITRNQSN